MPSRQAPACFVPTCRNRQPCPEHRPKNAPGRIRGRKLQRIRTAILSVQPICTVCAETLPLHLQRVSEQLDHITPLSQGGDDRRENLRGLCKQHHNEKSAEERWKRKRHAA